MARVFILLSMLVLFACDGPRRGHTIRVAGCVEGRVAPCTCGAGLTGTQVCLADDQFTACECTEVGDAGAGEDGGTGDVGLDKDSGSYDSGFQEDAGSGFDGGVRDTGAGDADSGAPFDTGVPFDSGAPHDTGVPFDSGVRDTGFPLDAGFPLDGGLPFPDGGLPFPDGGTGSLCELLPELGLSCSVDTDCNTIIPFGLLICESSRCVESCNCDTGPICQSPQVCDPIGGRCF